MAEPTQHAEYVAAEALLRDALRNSDMPWTSSEGKVMQTAKLAVATLREAGLLRLNDGDGCGNPGTF